MLLVFASVCAHADVANFDGYSPTDTCVSPISDGGLTFTGDFCLGVWLGNPNGNGTPSLIEGANGTTVITKTGGGAFDLNSFMMTISWYDANPTETLGVTVHFNGGGTAAQTITLIQGLQTYNFNFDNVLSVDVGPWSGSGYWLMDNVNFDPTPSVPEPASWILLGTLLGIAALMFRRKSAFTPGN
jgi:hypothetical protein